MPICSYLVIPEPGATDRVSAELSRIPGCEVIPSENREVLILITETSGAAADESLRTRVESLEAVEALLFTFGEIGSAVGVSPASGRTAGRGRANPSARGAEGDA